MVVIQAADGTDTPVAADDEITVIQVPEPEV